MHLIEEQQRRPRRSARAPARAASTAARMSLTPAITAESCDELRVGGLRDEARQRRLAGARRSPEDQRVQLPGCDGAAQRLAGPEQVLLADELLQRCAAACGRRAAARDRARSYRRGSLRRRADHIRARRRREAQLLGVAPGR